jgi:hypothetical protein
MPYLVCDEPKAAENVKYYTILGLGAQPMRVPASPEPDCGFKLDLSFLAPGAYTVKAQACNDYQCSLESDPFAFTVPERPAPPAGLSISS